MRRPLTTLLILLFITLLLCAVVLPATQAQEGGSFATPTPLPNSEMTSPTPQVVGLPFGEPFDSPSGWTTNGAWYYDTQSAYDGHGWYADGTQRSKVSTLTYANLIDLTGALSAQLLYRRKGYLPPSDLIAVDLSLDGGNTWFMIDLTIGIDTDWELHAVDLTDYRGQVILLRFRVNTGLQTEAVEPDEYKYWIDNLSIQFVSAEQAMVYLPPDTGPHTLMGLHLILGAQQQPVIDLVERLRAIGWPLGTLKGTTGTESILNRVAEISPETIIVYRSQVTPWGMQDCPNTANDPVMEAQKWIFGLQPYWRSVHADYYELTNECHPPIDWEIPFWIEAMRIAGEQQECLLMFSFASGNPEPAEYAQLLPIYEYALQHPCQPGRYHGIALHAYGMSTLVSESGLYLGLRHRLFYAQLLAQLPQAMLIPVYLTEAGAGDGRNPSKYTCEDIRRDVLQYTNELQFDPYVRGFHLWNVGKIDEWVDLTPCLPMIGDALVNYYAARAQP